MKSARVPGWVWVVLVSAHVVALWWALASGGWSFPDSGRYVQAADNLRLHGELYARPWTAGQVPQGQAVQEYTIRTIGYPLMVLGLRGELGKPVLLLVGQGMLSMLNIGFILGWWARHVRPKTQHWILAVLGVLTFPAQIIYASTVMSEVPLQSVVLALAVMGGNFITTGKTKYVAGVVACVIVALLLKPVFYPFVIVVASLGLWVAWQRRQPRLALWGMIPVLVVGLYMQWNEQRTGYFHFSSIADINLLHYNAAGVVRQVEGPVAEEHWVVDVLQEAGKQPNFAARQRVIQMRAGAVLWAHPVVYARQHIQGMGALWLDPGRFDISQFLGLGTPAGGGLLAQVRAGGMIQALQTLPLGLLSALGIILLANVARLVLAVRGFGRLRTEVPVLRYGRWVVVGLLLYVALLTGPLGAARFLVPVWPLLFGLALVGLKWRHERTVDSDPYQAAPMRENQR